MKKEIILNLYTLYQKLSKINELSNSILIYIKDSLTKSSPELNTNELGLDTDLIAYGVESIQVLSLIVAIEEKYALEVDLDRLEAFNYKISPQIIASFKQK